MDRMLSSEIGVSFGFGLGFFTTLLVMNHIFYLARLAIGQGMPFGIALQLFTYKVPYIVGFTAPMGVLLATVLGIGRLTDHHEISALRVSGVSLYRIALPVILLGCAAAAGTLVYGEGIVSIANDRYRMVLNDFLTRAPELQPVENVFFQGPSSEGTALYYARRYNPRTRTLEGVSVIYLVRGQPLRIVQAEEARYRQGGAWTFQRGDAYLLSEGKVLATKFAAMDVSLPRSPEELTLPAKQASDMSLHELSTQIVDARRRGADPRPYVSEFQNRIAGATSSIVFALIGFPLSLRPHRSGPSIGMGLSILVLCLYYAIVIPAQLASDGKVLPPAPAAWLPNVIVGALGGILLVRAAR
jgi:lipopolysaccharide export system permease protein